MPINRPIASLLYPVSNNLLLFFIILSTENSYWEELDNKMRGGSISKEFGTMNSAQIFDHLGWEKPIPKTSDNPTSNMEAVPTQATRLLNKKRKLMEN